MWDGSYIKNKQLTVGSNIFFLEKYFFLLFREMDFYFNREFLVGTDTIL